MFTTLQTENISKLELRIICAHTVDFIAGLATYSGAVLEITVSHFPTNFPHLAEQIQFVRPNWLYISNGKVIDNLQQCSCF